VARVPLLKNKAGHARRQRLVDDAEHLVRVLPARRELLEQRDALARVLRVGVLLQRNHARQRHHVPAQSIVRDLREERSLSFASARNFVCHFHRPSLGFFFFSPFFFVFSSLCVVGLFFLMEAQKVGNSDGLVQVSCRVISFSRFCYLAGRAVQGLFHRVQVFDCVAGAPGAVQG
jgi:hypothetical protein